MAREDAHEEAVRRSGRLPVVLEPAVLETLPSWVDRHARYYAVSRRVILEYLGLTDGSAERLRRYGVDLSERQLQALARSTDLTRQDLRRMTLSSFRGTLLSDFDGGDGRDWALASVREDWVYLATSLVCPGCLKDRAGAWHLHWRFPWKVACVQHRRLLFARCPRCKKMLGHGRGDRATTPSLPASVPEPSRCSNTPPQELRRGLTPCNYRLTSPRPISIDDNLADAQDLIDDVLAEGRASFAGVDVSGSEYFRELRCLVALLLRFAEPEDLSLPTEQLAAAFAKHAKFRESRTSSHADYARRLPRNPALLAAVLPAAVHITQAQDAGELRVLVSPWSQRLADRVRSSALSSIGARYGLTPRIDQAITAHLRRVRPGTAFDRSRRVIGAHRRRWQFEPRHVPQLFWLDMYRDRLEQFVASVRSEPARTFCSMALIKLCWRGTWADAAAQLNLAPQVARSRANGYMTRLNHDRTLGAFQERLADVAAALGDTVKLTDYRARTRHLAIFPIISSAEWRKVALAGLPDTESRRRCATAWLWSELTGNVPLSASSIAPFASQLRAGDYATFVRCHLAIARAPLRAIGEARLRIASLGRRAVRDAPNEVRLFCRRRVKTDPPPPDEN